MSHIMSHIITLRHYLHSNQKRQVDTHNLEQ